MGQQALINEGTTGGPQLDSNPILLGVCSKFSRRAHGEITTGQHIGSLCRDEGLSHSGESGACLPCSILLHAEEDIALAVGQHSARLQEPPSQGLSARVLLKRCLMPKGRSPTD